jgi:hypothetical protein
MRGLSGKEFNEKYKDVEFVKILRNHDTHHGFVYKNGLNVDTISFHPQGDCLSGGVSFTERNKMFYWFYEGDSVCKVKIPDDALVYEEEYKYKTDKFILDKKNKIEFQDLPELQNEEMCKLAVQQNGNVLEYVKPEFKTEEICRLAIKKYGCALRYVKPEFQTEEMCKLAVQQNGLALRFVKPEFITEEICKMAVQRNGFVLQYVKYELQNEEMCKLAIQQNRFVLEYVKPELHTLELCKLALEKDKDAYRYFSYYHYFRYKLGLL